MVAGGNSGDERHHAFQRALNFLKFRARSRQEIINYLQKKGFTLETASHVIQRLESSGLSGDAEFAQLWVESRLRHRPRGKYALTAELSQKGISADIITTVLAGIDEETAARDAARRKFRKWQHHDDAEISEKIISLLRRRGFPHALCRQIAEEMLQEKDVI
jgi:regulatory protein